MTVESWIIQAESAISDGRGVTSEALDQLRQLLQDPQQHLLYIWARADTVDADVVAWNYFGPFKSQFLFDPKNECPYASVKAAMGDGWRVVSFPVVEYPVDNAHNQLGHEFILERFFPPGEGLAQTPHGHRIALDG